MGEKNDDLASLSLWHKSVLVLALLSGAGNGFVGLTQDSSDRYHATTARQDLALRDSRINTLEKEVTRLRQWRDAHVRHSAEFTARIIQLEKAKQ